MKAFFISGVQRSGTTLLSVILSKHPAIYLDGYSVAFRLVSCFKNYSMVLPDNLKHSRKDILVWMIKNDYKGRLAELLDYENIDQYPDVRSLIRQSIENRLEENERTVWGDKSPNLQYYLPDMLTILPEAKFIHIVRDGRATAYSFAQRAYKNIYLAAQEWVDGNILGLVHQDLVGKENYLIIRYEDLLREPEKTIQQVCQFLDLPFDPAMLDLKEGRSTKDEAKEYVKSTFDQSKIDGFKEKLSSKEIRKIERIQGPLLQKMGYSLYQEHREKDFRQISAWKRIWLSQKDNIKKLFRSKKIGMNNRKNIEVEVPFKNRVYHFLLILGQDFLPLRLYKSIFRRSFIKKRYLEESADDERRTADGHSIV